MSSSLYQTFYTNNKFDDPTTIDNLTKWMIFKTSTANNLPQKDETPLCISCEETVDIISCTSSTIDASMHVLPDNLHTRFDIRNSGPKHNLYIPNRPNTLFWSLYIAYYGEAAYLAIGNKYGNAEIAEKQKIMEFLKPNKKILKTINKKITIGNTQEIMSDLMTNMKTSLLSVVAFAAYYKRNILLLNTINSTYVEHIYSTDITTPWIVIKYTEAKKYGVLLGDNIYDISPFVSDKYIYIETYDKPLKGISTYKMSELLKIAAKIPEPTHTPTDLSVADSSVISLSCDDNPSLVQPYTTILHRDVFDPSSSVITKSPHKNTTVLKSELYGKIWHHCLWV